MARYKFRLLAGRYSFNAGTDEKPNLVKFGMGDLIETDLELDVMFNSPGAIKFERQDYSGPDTQETIDRLEAELNKRKAALALAKSQEASVAEAAKKGFYGEKDVDKMSLQELQELAKANGIDLGKAKSRNEMLKLVQDALVSA